MDHQEIQRRTERKLKETIGDLIGQVSYLQAMNEALRERVAALEAEKPANDPDTSD